MRQELDADSQSLHATTMQQLESEKMEQMV